MPENTNVQNYRDQKIAGIGGWLLVFIISCGIYILRGYLEIPEVLAMVNDHPKFAIGFYCTIFLCGIWFLFLLYCLYFIIKIDKNAIRRIKLFLILDPIVYFFMPIIPLGVCAFTVDGFIINMNVISAAYSYESMVELSKTFIFSLLWYWYFSVSVRVKNTWSAQQ